MSGLKVAMCQNAHIILFILIFYNNGTFTASLAIEPTYIEPNYISHDQSPKVLRKTVLQRQGRLTTSNRDSNIDVGTLIQFSFDLFQQQGGISCLRYLGTRSPLALPT